MKKICITKGLYRQKDVSGVVAEMIKPFTEGTNGGYVTVRGDAFGFKNTKSRVFVDDENSYSVVDDSIPIGFPPGSATISPAAISATGGVDWVNAILEGDTAEESETETIQRINQRFEVLNELATGVATGLIRGLVVIGAPGVGKSFGIERKLADICLKDLLEGQKPNFEIIKGVITPVVLFMKLYEYSGEDQILVFDDCDSVFFDTEALNMLKAALDTGRRRYISYNSDSKLLSKEGIPNRFEFKGSVVFISNHKPSSTRSEKIRAHLSALMDRVLTLDLTIDTPRDRFLRVKSVVKDSEILDSYSFGRKERDLILDYIRKNIGRLENGVSLRTVINLADLIRLKPQGWEYLANNTMLSRQYGAMANALAVEEK